MGKNKGKKKGGKEQENRASQISEPGTSQQPSEPRDVSRQQPQQDLSQLDLSQMNLSQQQYQRQVPQEQLQHLPQRHHQQQQQQYQEQNLAQQQRKHQGQSQQQRQRQEHNFPQQQRKHQEPSQQQSYRQQEQNFPQQQRRHQEQRYRQQQYSSQEQYQDENFPQQQRKHQEPSQQQSYRRQEQNFPQQQRRHQEQRYRQQQYPSQEQYQDENFPQQQDPRQGPQHISRNRQRQHQPELGTPRSTYQQQTSQSKTRRQTSSGSESVDQPPIREYSRRQDIARPETALEQPISAALPQQKSSTGTLSASGSQPSSAPVSSAKGDANMTSTLVEVSLLPPKLRNCIKVYTNHFKLRFKEGIVYHYDVVMNEKAQSKSTKKVSLKTRFCSLALDEMKRLYYPNYNAAFDGRKNLYSFRRLPFQDGMLDGEVNVWDHERNKSIAVDVEIKLVNEIDLGEISKYMDGGSSSNIPQEQLQALDIVLRNPISLRFQKVGRSFFSPPSGIVWLSKGVSLWHGFCQSAIIGWKSLYLNFDVTHKGFTSDESCINIFCEYLRCNQEQLLNKRRVERNENFEHFIKGLRVTYEIPKKAEKRSYIIKGLSDCPNKNKFNRNGEWITVEQYYREEYDYRIQFPFVPCLRYGDDKKPRSLPMELCRLKENQPIRALNGQQKSKVIEAVVGPADQRMDKIGRTKRDVDFNNNDCMREFGLEVSNDFTLIEDARVLKPPKLDYLGESKFVTRGVWYPGRFQAAVPLMKWAILCNLKPASGRSFINIGDIQNLIELLKKNTVGMQISNPDIIEFSGQEWDLNNTLKDLKDQKYQLAMIILSNNMIYSRVKHIAEQQVGILTQCLKEHTLKNRMNPSTAGNILLKLNSKLDGRNHNISTCLPVWMKYFSEPTIVFGADVTHPPPTNQNSLQNKPSIAAVAATYEPTAFSYNMEWRFQQPNEEIIQDLKEIVYKQLMAFRNHNSGAKPKKIFFYRDGVPQTRFQQVLNTELRAIRDACKMLQKVDYEPAITFIVVQKRHHTRFFPSSQKDEEGKCKNVPAGTVVDTVITNKNEIDFYLVSHASIKGTSKPTRYHVLWDDSDMSENDLEEITFYLCHLFSRCNRAVSYPAPTYNAHLAAARALSYYDPTQFNLEDLEREQTKNRVKEDLLISNPMYFV